jgi:chromate transporter
MKHAFDELSAVLRVFLKLGLMSFGGPIAHLGYFRNAFVAQRHWLDERAPSPT